MTKATEYLEQIKADRETWRQEMQQVCMCCGESDKSWPGLQIHEIDRRSHCSGRWGVRCNYLLLCQDCHHDHFDLMSHAEQLAYKLICDSSHFDLSSWLKIRDPDLNAPERVTMREIIVRVKGIMIFNDEGSRLWLGAFDAMEAN